MYPSIKNQRSPIFFFMIGILSISFCAQEKMYHLPDIEEYQLKNGMRILISPNYDNPTVYISVYLNAGTLDDPLDQIGLASRTFSKIKEGTIKYSKKGQVKEKLFSLGSDNGKFKSEYIEDTYGYIENYFLKEDTRKGVELFSEVLMNPSFPLFNLGIQRFAVRVLPKKSFTSTWSLANIHMKNQYANLMEYLHPKYQLSYTKKDIKNWYNKYIRPENTTFMVVGDINYIYIQKLVEEYFGNWNSTVPMPKTREYPINISDSSRIQLRFVNIKNSKDAILRVITKGPSFNDSWHTAGQLAMLAFGGDGFSSRLAKIHDKFNRYSYLNYDWQEESRLPYSAIFGEVQYSDLYDLYNEIISEFNKLSNNSITKAELQQAKSIRKNYYNNKLHNPEEYSEIIQTYYNNNGYNLDSIADKWEEVDKVTLDGINDAAGKIYDPNNFMILVMGNQDSCATFLNRFDNVEYYKPGEELR